MSTYRMTIRSTGETFTGNASQIAYRIVNLFDGVQSGEVEETVYHAHLAILNHGLVPEPEVADILGVDITNA